MSEESNKSYVSRMVTAKELNPFSEDLLMEVSPRNKTVAFAGKGNAIINRDTGEMVGDMAVIGVQKTVDRTEFVKIYERGIRAAFDLKPAAQGVFSVFLEAYRRSKNIPDKLYFNYKIASRDFLYERTNKTFLSGINELLNRKFIAEVAGEKGWYWVNPSLFFKGDRLRIVNEYVSSKKKDTHAELEARGQQRLNVDPE